MTVDGTISPAEGQEEALVDTGSLVGDRDSDRAIAEPSRARRWPWIAAAVVLVLAVVVLVAAVASSGDDATIDTAAAPSFADVVQADLVEQESYDGILGTEAGDPINSPLQGTVTDTAAVGTLIEQGDPFLSVNNEPVVLLYGDLPAYRALQPTADSRTLIGNATGIVTEVVAEGETIEQGDVLYRVDGEPVVALYGEVPAYRTLRDLSENMKGDDVLQLEQALVDLGYDEDGTATVDTEFTDYTETMVERWQEDLGVEEDGVVLLGDIVFISAAAEVLDVSIEVGQSVGPGQPVVTVTAGAPLAGDDVLQLQEALDALGYDVAEIDGSWDDSTKTALIAWQTESGMEPDGVVDLGEVVFLSSTVRVNEVLASVGSSVSPGSPVLGVSSADQFVTFDLPAADQGLLAVGQEVNIEMPDGSDTPGSVVSVAAVATAGPQGEAAFEVKIVLDDPSVAVGLDEAPVDVEVVSDSVSDVMAVPVSALVALSEGGYAVEVDAGGGSTRLVAVEPGFYAEGLVEVVSGSLSVGDRVVVP